MKRDEALKLLGLEKAACLLTPGLITSAYRRTVVSSHPDTAAEGALHHDMVKLQQARKTLLGDTETQNNACAQCRGRGSVRYRMGVTPCGACKGTGETYGR